MKHTLIVFARAPMLGAVKARLAATVGDAAALAVYEKLLTRMLRLADAAQFDARHLCYAGATGNAYFKNRLNDRWQLFAQNEGTLGQRMQAAMERAQRQASTAILVGSDVADCSADDFAAARQYLSAEAATAVLGPSTDGGYWLIGLNRRSRSCFDLAQWSTPNVCAQTRRRLTEAGFKVHELTPRNDIDVVEDLERLAFEY